MAQSISADHRRGRLTARPLGTDSGTETRSGTFALGLGMPRDGLIHLPPGASSRGAPIPLVVAFHGAGGTAAQVLPLLAGEADRRGFAVLAPDSRASSWDVIHGSLGPDVAFLDVALGAVFRAARIDPGRIAVAGFSDGASYALTLGLLDADLFSDVLAFSPGFSAGAPGPVRPRVFISHGRGDRVLPVDRCGRRIARSLDRLGVDVDYREFDDGHVVPPELARAAVDRFLSQPGTPSPAGR